MTETGCSESERQIDLARTTVLRVEVASTSLFGKAQ